MKLRLGSIVVVGLSVAACGSDGGSGGPSRASDAVKENFQAQCDRAHECQASWDPSMHDGETFESIYGATPTECYDSLIALFEQLVPNYFNNLDAAVSAGTVVYNAGDFGTCVDALLSGSCDAFFEQNGMSIDQPPQCETALVGTVAEGGTCTISDECAGDAFCDIPDGATTGTCVP